MTYNFILRKRVMRKGSSKKNLAKVSSTEKFYTGCLYSLISKTKREQNYK